MADEQKNIIISVSVDNTDAVAGIDEVKNKLDDVSDTPLDKPFKNFKAQIKEATVEAQKLEQQFGKNSEEFRNAARRVAELKDNYQEFGNSVNAFNPDNKLTSLTAAARGAAGAIQGVTGAMQFLGVESDDAQQAIAKLQGLMAFTDALDSIDDIENAYNDFKNTIGKSTIIQSLNNGVTRLTTGIFKLLKIEVVATSTAFKGLRGALIATGIGALVVLIGTLVEALSNYTSEAEKAADKQKDFNEQVKKFADIGLQGEQASIAREESLALAKAKLAGKTQDEIFKIEQDFRAQKGRALIRYYDEIKGIDAEEAVKVKQQINQINTEGQLAELNNQIRLKEIKEGKGATTEKPKPTTKTKTQEQLDAEADKKSAAEQLKDLEQQNFLDAEKDEFERRKKKLEQDFNNKVADNELLKIDSAEKTKLAKELLIKYNFEVGLVDKDIADKKIADEQAAKDAQKEKDDKAREERLEKERKAAEEEVRIQEEKYSFLTGVAEKGQQILDITQGFAQQGTDFQKGLAVTSVVVGASLSIFDLIKDRISSISAARDANINTIANLTPLLTNPLFAPAASAGIVASNANFAQSVTRTNVNFGLNSAIVAGQAGLTISKILSANKTNTSVNPATGGGGGGGTAGNAPQIIATQTAPQEIQDVRVTNQGQAPIRAFITDRDLRSNEQRTNFLNNLSTF